MTTECYDEINPAMSTVNVTIETDTDRALQSKLLLDPLSNLNFLFYAA